MESIIDFSEVRQFIDTPVKRYSSGMYVKLAFSVAAHLDSEIMIMDEVLAVGDMAFQQKCLTKMRDVSNEEGRTILYVSHNMNTIRQLCDRVVVLSHGTVIFDGEVEEGINYYLGIAADRFPSYYDFMNVERPRISLGAKIRVTEFEFLEKTAAIYDKSREKLRFRVSFLSKAKLDGIRLILAISSVNGERVGFMQCATSIIDTEPDTNYVVELEADISKLICGKYHFIIDVFNLDDNGNHLSYDHPNLEVSFSIIDTNPEGIKPNITRWGAIEISKIKTINTMASSA